MPIESDGSVEPRRLKKLEENPHRFFSSIGARVIYAARDRIKAELPIRAEISNHGGNIHGGAIMSFADHLGGLATMLNLPPGGRTTTIESKTNFFAAIMTGDVAQAECTPLHRGRSTMVWQTRITRGDGKLAAVVAQTQMVIANPKERVEG